MTHLVDGRVVTRLGTAQGVPAGPIRSLVFNDGDLWLAYLWRRSGAVSSWLPACSSLVPRGRRFEQALSAIVVDTLDRFWLLGRWRAHDGDRMTNSRPRSMRAQPLRGAVELGPADGVPEANGGFPERWLDRKAHRLWVATVDGVVDRQPGAVLPGGVGAAAPHRRRQARRYGCRRDRLPCVVPAKVNGLEIRFTAPSFGGRDGLQFTYRLRGHDRDWVESGSSRVGALRRARRRAITPSSWPDGAGTATERSAPVSLPVTVAARVVGDTGRAGDVPACGAGGDLGAFSG